MNKIILALPLYLAMVTQNSFGFELATHAAMTYYAFQHSNVAGNSEVFFKMGMPDLDSSMQAGVGCVPRTVSPSEIATFLIHALR